MKTQSLKQIARVISFVISMNFALPAEAIQKSQSLGSSILATDLWYFTCPSGTTVAQVRIFDATGLTNPALLKATFAEDSSPTLFTTDPTEGGVWSTWAVNNLDGPGTYALTVTKNLSGNDDYTVEAQCLPTGPTSLILQINQ